MSVILDSCTSLFLILFFIVIGASPQLTDGEIENLKRIVLIGIRNGNQLLNAKNYRILY